MMKTYRVQINRTYIARLEKVQERAIRLVYSDKDCSYYDLLLRAKVASVIILNGREYWLQRYSKL